MLYTRIAAAVGVAATLASAGCGSGGPSTTTSSDHANEATATAVASTAKAPQSRGSSKDLTRSQLVAEANRVCRAVVAHRATIAAKFTSQQEIRKNVPILAAYEGAALTGLAERTAPGSLANGWREMAGYFKKYVAADAKWGSFVQANRIKAGYKQFFPVMGEIDSHIRLIAHREGISACAQM